MLQLAVPLSLVFDVYSRGRRATYLTIFLDPFRFPEI